METDNVAAAVAYSPELDKFLLLKRADSRERFPEHWEFPSGFIEKAETVEEAVLRELKEETGLKGEIVKTGESFPIEIPKVEVHPVLVKVSEEEVKLSREHSQYKWVGKSDLKAFKTVPKLKQDLENVGIK